MKLMLEMTYHIPANRLKTRFHHPGRTVLADENGNEKYRFPVLNMLCCASAVSYSLLYTSSRTSAIKNNYPPRIKVKQESANFGRTFSGILLELTAEKENITVSKRVGHLGNVHAGVQKQMLGPVDPGLDNVGLHG